VVHGHSDFVMQSEAELVRLYFPPAENEPLAKFTWKRKSLTVETICIPRKMKMKLLPQPIKILRGTFLTENKTVFLG
jgi:hypothetical protein